MQQIDERLPNELYCELRNCLINAYKFTHKGSKVGGNSFFLMMIDDVL